MALQFEHCRLVEDAARPVVAEEAVIDAATRSAKPTILAGELKTARNLRMLLHVPDRVLHGVQEERVPVELVRDHVERASQQPVAMRTCWGLAVEVILQVTPVCASRQAAERAAVDGEVEVVIGRQQTSIDGQKLLLPIVFC